MKSPPRAAFPPNIEFLPLTAAPAGCGFKLLADVLVDTGLSQSIDLVAALRDGLNPAIYTAGGDDMLADPGAWSFGLDVVTTNREVAAERDGRAA
jgi:hypothetical protein